MSADEAAQQASQELAEVPVERAALPTDPGLLPELGAGFWSIVREGCADLVIELTGAQLAAIEVHARLLLAWNRHINLTAIRSEEDVARLHVVDSLTALGLLRRNPRPPSILDLGSGGGYPGIPLGVALPGSRTGLVDSVGKKVRFLEVAADAAMGALRAGGEGGPDGSELRAVLARAEQLAALPDQRESWDAVTARAVGSLAEVAELGLPLLRVGGRLLAWKRDDGSGALRRELADAAPLIRAAGGSRPDVAVVRLRDLPGHRLVTIRKVARTPGRFPRPPAERRRP